MAPKFPYSLRIPFVWPTHTWLAFCTDLITTKLSICEHFDSRTTATANTRAPIMSLARLVQDNGITTSQASKHQSRCETSLAYLRTSFGRFVGQTQTFMWAKRGQFKEPQWITSQPQGMNCRERKRIQDFISFVPEKAEGSAGDFWFIPKRAADCRSSSKSLHQKGSALSAINDGKATPKACCTYDIL